MTKAEKHDQQMKLEELREMYRFSEDHPQDVKALSLLLRRLVEYLGQLESWTG